MEKQGKYSCLETGMPVDGSFYERLQRETSGGSHCYIVPDYETDEQGKEIADTFSEAGFYTGGSGLMEHLANKLKAHICHKETTGFTKKGLLFCNLSRKLLPSNFGTNRRVSEKRAAKL